MLVKSDIDLIFPYLSDVSNNIGNADAVYIPETENDICELLKECSINNTSVTISGAGTGTTGSRVPQGGVVLSMERLNKIISFNHEKMTLTVQPAVTVREIYKFAAEHNLMYVSNPTEIDSSIGGNLATNASGSRSFKYGATRNYVNRIKIILTDGQILNIKRGEVFADNYHCSLVSENETVYKFALSEFNMPQVKHAAGYYIKKDMDLIDLFIGITEIEIQLLRAPLNLFGAIIYFKDDGKMLDFVEYVRNISKNRSNENDIIESRLIEYYDRNSLALIAENYPNVPISANSAIWIEQEIFGNNEDEIMEHWNNVILKYSDMYDETWVAIDEAEHKKMGEFRHSLPLKIYDSISGYKYSKIGSDTAVPLDYFREYYTIMQSRLKESNLNYVIFGHIGDCHLHSNIFANNDEEFEKGMIIFREFITKSIENGGTISAEHGVGKIKKQYLKQMYPEYVINGFKSIKKALDPKLILGRGTMFDF